MCGCAAGIDVLGVIRTYCVCFFQCFFFCSLLPVNSKEKNNLFHFFLMALATAGGAQTSQKVGSLLNNNESVLAYYDCCLLLEFKCKTVRPQIYCVNIAASVPLEARRYERSEVILSRSTRFTY